MLFQTNWLYKILWRFWISTLRSPRAIWFAKPWCFSGSWQFFSRAWRFINSLREPLDSRDQYPVSYLLFQRLPLLVFTRCSPTMYLPPYSTLIPSNRLLPSLFVQFDRNRLFFKSLLVSQVGSLWQRIFYR